MRQGIHLGGQPLSAPITSPLDATGAYVNAYPLRSDVHHIDAVVNAIAHIDVKAPRLTKQRVVAGGATSVAVAGGLALAIRLRFHNHAPQQLAIRLAFHQQAADELGGNQLSGTAEEGLGEVLGGRGGYGSGFVRQATNRNRAHTNARNLLQNGKFFSNARAQAAHKAVTPTTPATYCDICQSKSTSQCHSRGQ